MSGDTVAVKPGPPQQLSGASLSTGTVIYNNDDTNAVWISSVQAMGVGNGMLLAPLATATWTGKQLWACVDTGVLDPVLLFVSSDVSQVDNPVAVATAVAIALLQSGIPLVLKSEVIFDQTVAAGANVGPIAVDKYAGLYIICDVPGPIVSTPIFLSLIFEDALGNVIMSDALAAPQPGGFVGLQRRWYVPVWGPDLILINSGLTQDITVIGTNRSFGAAIIPLDKLDFLHTASRTPSPAPPGFVAGSTYALQADSVINATGLVSIHANISGTVIKGLFYMTDTSGNAFRLFTSVELLDEQDSSRGLSRNFILPPTGLQLFFFCSVGGVGTVTVAYMGGNSPT